MRGFTPRAAIGAYNICHHLAEILRNEVLPARCQLRVATNHFKGRALRVVAMLGAMSSHKIMGKLMRKDHPPVYQGVNPVFATKARLLVE